MAQSHSIRNALPAIECLLCDLDGTLYPIANGYEQHCRFQSWHTPPAISQSSCAYSGLLLYSFSAGGHRPAALRLQPTLAKYNTHMQGMVSTQR